MPAPERHIPVDHTCFDVIPQRVLHVTEVWFDQYIRIEYTITPPLPIVDVATKEVLHIAWLWHAVDGLGNTYTDCGGAYGLAEDGQCTQGVLSLQPLPPLEAQWLRIVLTPSFWSEAKRTEWKTSECSFEVALIG